MKNVLLVAAASVALLGFAGVANAAPVVDVNLQLADVSQAVTKPMTQHANASANVDKIAGRTETSALAAGNSSSITAKVDPLDNANSQYEGLGAIDIVAQRVTAQSTQVATATLKGGDVTAPAITSGQAVVNASSIDATIK
jgi:hypothetical protein